MHLDQNDQNDVWCQANLCVQYIDVTSQGILARRARINVSRVFFLTRFGFGRVIIDIMDEYRGVVPSIFQVVYTDVYMGPCSNLASEG